MLQVTPCDLLIFPEMRLCVFGAASRCYATCPCAVWSRGTPELTTIATGRAREVLCWYAPDTHMQLTDDHHLDTASRSFYVYVLCKVMQDVCQLELDGA